ncbi:hypothetical protein HZS_886 [Henneguya salminicola]|nr:hypothetical protein HZS_886 [Henneguya salminicola]
MSVEIKKWTAVALWHWIANDITCGICRNSFDGCCTNCKTPGDDCPMCKGSCSHCFHSHCIKKWLEIQILCPMCRSEWHEVESG